MQLLPLSTMSGSTFPWLSSYLLYLNGDNFYICVISLLTPFLIQYLLTIPSSLSPTNDHALSEQNGRDQGFLLLLLLLHDKMATLKTTWAPFDCKSTAPPSDHQFQMDSSAAAGHKVLRRSMG